MRSCSSWWYAGPATLALLTAACEQPTKVTALDGGVARLVVTPKIATLRTTQTVDLMVVALSDNGDTVPATVSWSATSGSLADTSTNGGRHYGRYKAGTNPGTVKVIAVGNPGGQADTAVVTVTLVPVQSVAVTPAGASVAPGVTAQLSAATLDSAGTQLSGRAVTWGTSNNAVATVNGSGLVTGVAAGTATITATSEGQSGTAAITVTAVAGNPGTVSDLALAGVTDNLATLSFTEVTDGAGQPASYEIRLAAGSLSWGGAADVSLGSCKVPLAGTAIGAKRSCTVQGLSASTGYQFQLVAYRGTLNVNAVFGALSNVTSGTTSTSTAPVASVTLSPASAGLAVAGTQQLTATLKDAGGNVLTGRAVSWTSSAPLVASVSGSGLVTGLVVGSATITATSEGQSGTVAITVTAVPPPPPPGTWANEPVGYTLLSDYGFTDAIPRVNDGPVGSGWKILNPDNGQPLVPGYAVAGVDPTGPMGSAVGQFIYPVGMRDGWAPATMYYAGFSATEMYAGFWWKPSNPWQSDNSGVNKIAFLFGGPAQIYISMNRSGGVFHLRVEDEINAPTTNYDPNVTLTPITLGQWHKVEWWVSTTGGLKFWLDGVLQGSYPGVRWASPFTMFQFSPTWGGNGGDVKAQLDSYSYNHVHLSRR